MYKRQAGYIAYAIADRPGLAPGFVMGGLAGNIFGVQSAGDNPVAMPATGFIGAIIGGVLAGVIAHWITGWKVPTWMRGLMPVLVIPLLTSIIAGLLMITVFGQPIGRLMDELTDALNSMSGSRAILLGGYEIVGPYGDIAVNYTIFNLPNPEALGLDHALFNSGLMAYIGALFFIIGKTAFMLFIPALAGYIAYAIADRPGIAPGFIMGGLAANLFNVQYQAEGADAVALPSMIAGMTRSGSAAANGIAPSVM